MIVAMLLSVACRGTRAFTSGPVLSLASRRGVARAPVRPLSRQVAFAEPLSAAVAAKGDEVRALKASGAGKEAVSAAVAELLALKAEAAAPPAAPALEAAVAAKGDEVRALKASGAGKEAVAAAVAELLALKAEAAAASSPAWPENRSRFSVRSSAIFACVLWRCLFLIFKRPHVSVNSPFPARSSRLSPPARAPLPAAGPKILESWRSSL